jgi:hypothetical protein
MNISRESMYCDISGKISSFLKYVSTRVSIPTPHNIVITLLHPKNFYTAIRIPPKYYTIIHDSMKKGVIN